LASTPFYTVPDVLQGDERGLLGLAFHPDYATNGRYFLHYTGKDGQTVLEGRVRGADPDVAAKGPGTVLLTEPQPESNHNGGAIEFGADGFLYLGLGDGGGGGDKHGTSGNGQNTSKRLGKILRIDVDNQSAGLAYAIPPGNLSGAGIAPEIWDYGLRNPWRLSFDVCTGDLWIADVGQEKWEEINFEPKGTGKRNYGWRAREGMHCYDQALCTSEAGQAGLVEPVAEYAHEKGRCSVTGGYVYRGSRVPSLRGRYFFADYCTHEIFSMQMVDGVASTPENVTSALGAASLGNILSFGQDNAGELYVASTSGVYLLDLVP
jgi:glucose/arabinose dehydrogenase